MQFRANIDNESTKLLRLQLDEKAAELDDAQSSVNKIRNEFIRRQEQLKREADDKIAFLLHQLRHAENKVSSSINSEAFQSSPMNRVNTGGGVPITPARVPQLPERQLFDAVIENSGVKIRTKPGASVSDNSNRRISDAELTRQSISSEAGAAGGGGGTGGTGSTSGGEGDQQSHQEILRRWLSEKERREQLEKRNGELMREMRALRQSVKPSTSS